MALSRQKKEDTVSQVQQLLDGSKLTVFARYQGTPVKEMQYLRSQAKQDGTSVKVIKNRLFKKALQTSGNLGNVQIDDLKGQLLYAFNDSDEVAPARNLAEFAKQNPQIEFVGAVTDDGRLLNADDVKNLADLPTKEQLRGQLVGLIASPLSGLANVLAGNIRGVVNVLNARADNLS